MKRLLLIVLILLFLPIGILYAQDFSGTYRTHEDGDAITLNLKQDDNGRVTGAMSFEGIEYSIKGQRKQDRIIGRLSAFDEALTFSAWFSANDLLFILSDPEEMQYGSGGLSETLIFQRSKDKAVATPHETITAGKSKPSAAINKGEVIINGVPLSAKQVVELEKTYNIKPRPGRYWYDAQSVLYGAFGFPAFGFMLPGHKYGKLQRNASNGNTGVFVNGRELPMPEWLVWNQLLGYVIPLVRYWLDANGNAGHEGNPIPTENLYIAAQRNAYRAPGGSGGGDNFWSTRFSAGNYDSGNQRGYVSVPGHGPIGYGF